MQQNFSGIFSSSPSLEQCADELIQASSKSYSGPDQGASVISPLIDRLNHFKFEDVYSALQTKLGTFYKVLGEKISDREYQSEKRYAYDKYDILVGRLKKHFGLPFYVVPDFVQTIENQNISLEKRGPYLRALYCIQGIFEKNDEHLISLFNKEYPGFLRQEKNEIFVGATPIGSLIDKMLKEIPQGKDPVETRCRDSIEAAQSESKIVLENYTKSRCQQSF